MFLQLKSGPNKQERGVESLTQSKTTMTLSWKKRIVMKHKKMSNKPNYWVMCSVEKASERMEQATGVRDTRNSRGANRLSEWWIELVWIHSSLKEDSQKLIRTHTKEYLFATTSSFTWSLLMNGCLSVRDLTATSLYLFALCLLKHFSISPVPLPRPERYIKKIVATTGKNDSMELAVIWETMQATKTQQPEHSDLNMATQTKHPEHSNPNAI